MSIRWIYKILGCIGKFRCNATLFVAANLVLYKRMLGLIWGMVKNVGFGRKIIKVDYFCGYQIFSRAFRWR